MFVYPNLFVYVYYFTSKHKKNLNSFSVQSIPEIFDTPFTYSKDNQTVNLHGFHQFLSSDQNDLAVVRDLKSVSNFINDFVQDPQREVEEPYLTISEVRK